MNLTDAERKRRSDQAIRLRQEGKFGGPQPGSGRPRKKRASELIAEKASNEADELWAELKALREDKSSAIRIKALLATLEIEERERGVAAEEEAVLDRMRRDELVKFVMDKLELLQEKGIVPDGVIDGISRPVHAEIAEKSEVV